MELIIFHFSFLTMKMVKIVQNKKTIPNIIHVLNSLLLIFQTHKWCRDKKIIGHKILKPHLISNDHNP